MTRQFFVGGNFRMNPDTMRHKMAIIDVLNKADLDPSTEVIIAPPISYLLFLEGHVRKETRLAAQNCYFKRSGAFTGEIRSGIAVPSKCSVRAFNVTVSLVPRNSMSIGISYVILGHSERRALFYESSESVGLKTKAALDAYLKVILCVGETLVAREAGNTTEVVNRQLQAVVDLLKDADGWSEIVIAYEPVWAISTGKIATAAQAQDAYAEIRKFLKAHVSESVAETTRIIYGGSVTAANSKELATQPDVDGFLVGGASLRPEFVDIINVKRE